MQVKCQNGTTGAEAPTVPTGHWTRFFSASPAKALTCLEFCEAKLLDLDGRDALELLGDGCRVFLRDVLLQRLGSAVNQVLGLLETKRGDLAHCLDGVDLVRARILQDDGELGLLLNRSRGCAAARCRSRRHGGRSRRDAETLLELLHQLRSLEQGEANDLIFQLLNVCHFVLQYCLFLNSLLLITFPRARAPGCRRSFQVSVAPRQAHPEGVATKLSYPQRAPSKPLRRPARPSSSRAERRRSAALQPATPRHALQSLRLPPCPPWALPSPQPSRQEP